MLLNRGSTEIFVSGISFLFFPNSHQYQVCIPLLLLKHTICIPTMTDNLKEYIQYEAYIPIWDFSLKLHEMNGNFLSTFSPVFIKCTFCLKLNQQTNKWNTAKVSLKLCGGTTLFQSIQWSTNKSTEYNNVSSNIRKTFNHYDFKFVILFCRGELLNSTVVSQSEQWVAPT